MSLRKIAGKIASSNAGWSIVRPIVKAGSFFQWKRKEAEDARIKKIENEAQDEAAKVFTELFSDLTVLHGPFKGMKYPSLDAVGSGLYPKLIGSYEKELSGVIELICRQDYSDILDIGCAEGYYAVGCSMRLPSAMVVAYDTSEKARTLCALIAKLNDVGNRIKIHAACTPDDLANFKFNGKGFIICDCEGYEYELFNETNIANLRNCDLIIEVHDFINAKISARLRRLFSGTHEISVIKSISDEDKAVLYHYHESENLTLLLKKILFKEGRPGIMEWLLLSSKDQ